MGRELKRASVPVWPSLPALKRTNQHFSYFMPSLRAVCISLQEKQNSSAWPIHGALWPKQTPHFDIYHSRCTQPLLWALTKTEFLTFFTASIWVKASLKNRYYSNENWVNRRIKAWYGANLINCEIKGGGATMTYVETRFGPLRPPGTPLPPSCTGPILSTYLYTVHSRVNTCVSSS